MVASRHGPRAAGSLRGSALRARYDGPVRKVTFGSATVRDLTREVLLTDGLGSFALSTLAGVPTRSYSGLAVSSNPPVQRHVMWVAARETLEVAGQSRTLHAFEVAPGVMDGDGLGCVQAVTLRDLLPERVQFTLGVRVARRAVMPRHGHALVLLYDIECREGVALRLGGLFTDRDMHATLRRLPPLVFEQDGNTLTVRGAEQTLTARLHAPSGSVALLPLAPVPQRLHLREEAARGEADTDVTASLDAWEVQFAPGTHRLALVLDGLGDASEDPWAAWNAEAARRDELVRRAWNASGVHDAVVATLAVAADAFLVRRRSVASTSVIAGYPWFADWGRDSMIALGGLALDTGRFEEAREVLRTFLQYRRRGLVPNNFWDDGQGAGYNTVDGALWLFVAFERYVTATGDDGFAREHLSALREMLTDLAAGSDFGVRVAHSGLLRAGERGAQLTWMDVKIHDWVVTPRHGHPVEVAALWLAALGAYDRVAARLGEPEAFGNLRARGEAAFAAFWQAGAYPADVLADDGAPDTSVRPNALLALALPDTPATEEQLEGALRVAERELLTPLGLRTLSPLDARYAGRFAGHRYVRDAAYHQGTVWPWLLGAYVSLLVRRGEHDRAREALRGLEAHLWEAGVGSVSEVFGGDDGVPGGCPFQAWSVAEFLRAYVLARRG